MGEAAAPKEAKKSSQPQFGPYLLKRTVGEGEFGKVKLSIHSKTKKEVAIKLLKKERISTAARRAKVMREISMLQALDHPYIVKLIEVVETDAYIGLVMEYASGGEMFHYIMAQPDGKLKEPEARKFFAQLVSGVSYIHSVGIVHRDLKLENLLLGPDNNILISDFGFANKNSEHMETSCGSPGYAAPELVISNGYVGDSADIWSCGVILYGMLCGYLPYDDDPANPESENINLLYQYILSTKLTYPTHVSSLARGVIGIMLVPDPRKRGKMSEVMGHGWLAPEAHIFKEELARRMKQFGYTDDSSDNNTAADKDARSSSENVTLQKSASVKSGNSSSKSLSMKRNPTNWLWGNKGSGNGPTITPIHGEPEDLPSADVTDVNRLSLAYSNSISNSHVGVLRDRKLRVHTGPVDTKALSTRDPLDLLLDMESLFEQKFGWIVQSNGQATGEYKLKVLKPRGVKVGKVEVEASSSETPASSESTTVNIQESGAINDPKMTQIVNSLPVSLVSRIKNFMYQLRPNASKGFDGTADVTKSDLGITGMEEEMTFTVEIQQIKDMRGTNVVEFRRLKGDVWGFKRLYIDVIERLPLSE